MKIESIRMQPIEHVVKEFGGVACLAKSLGVKYDAVWKWQSRNSIPQEMHIKILDLAKKKGFDVFAEDLIFGRHLYLSNILDCLKEIKRNSNPDSLQHKVLEYAFNTVNPYQALIDFSNFGINTGFLKAVNTFVVQDIFNLFFDELEKIRHRSGYQIPQGKSGKEFMVDLGLKHTSSVIIDQLKEVPVDE